MDDGSGLFGIMAHHQRLETERKNLDGRLFISDYHGGHPFIADYLGPLAASPAPHLGDIARYAGLDDDLVLRRKIAALHHDHDHLPYSAAHVLPSGGSSSLLGTICTWLSLTNRKRVHYLPPVYFKFAYLFHRFAIQPIPVADRHAFQPDFRLRLPAQRSVLLLTDPIWYAGMRVTEHVLDAIGEWQRATGSLIVVDGTFQYMRWDGDRREPTAQLDPELTLRLVCPTKYLSLHGYRCAWLLAPEGLRDQLAELHLNLHGDVPLSDLLFTHRACEVMSTRRQSRPAAAHPT